MDLADGAGAMPRVLVCVATKHGGTEAIADRIAATLRGSGLEVDAAAPEAVGAIGRYDAFVIGSAVYAGRWMAAARDFVEDNAPSLGARPVWLFSSGPIGDRPAEDPVDLEKMTVLSTARGHRVFGGRLDSDELGLLERAVVTAVRAPDGDYRPWDEIDDWAAEISAELLDERST